MGPIRRRSASYSLGLLILAPLITGCQGCRDDPAVADRERDRPANEIIAGPLRSLPEDTDRAEVPVKPGHWMSLSQSWKATGQDHRGELVNEPRWRDRSATTSPAELLASPLRAVRPAVLPKGQAKELDSRLLIPPLPRGNRSALSIDSRFEISGQPLAAGEHRTLVMAPDEYFFVVLTERPERFAALQLHDWASPPSELITAGDIAAASELDSSLDYRVVFPFGEGRLPIPDTFFEWTSTAYVLWDDVMPEKLTVDQRQAIRDWVHWGGQIIVNGPAAAHALAASELSDLLPLESIRSEPLAGDQFAQLMQRWSVRPDASVIRLTERLEEDQARGGISGDVAAGATSIAGTDGLVVERNSGRGRVVLTRFDLAAGWLPQWSSTQSFYNALLLRRPPREYRLSDRIVHLGFAGLHGERSDDARLSTRLRIFARDAALPAGAGSDEVQADGADSPAGAGGWFDPGIPYTPGAAVATWTDRSDVGLVADQLLREEAGITIPSGAFVAKSLAIYLFILVPLNYLVFALLGRLEWAWVAVPVIGLVGAAWVARAAQLDIGFARSRTEINLLEIQGGYPRGHLSRYMAIYNSLSTTYRLQFEDRAAVAAPMGVFSDRSQAADWLFRHAFDTGVTLDRVSIPSNQTKAIHAEQMLPLGGSLRIFVAGEGVEVESGQSGQSERGEIESGRVENGTGLTLLDTVLVMRWQDGSLRHDVLGMLAPGGAATYRVRSGPGGLPSDLPMGIRTLMQRLVAGDDLAPGECRLVGRSDDAQPGLIVAPEVRQTQQQTVVVAHLRRPPLPSPVADRNLRSDFPRPEPGLLLEFEEEDLP